MTGPDPRPRIAPGTRRQLGWPVWAFSRAAGLVARTGPPAVFTVLGRHRKLFRRWLVFAAALMPGGGLPRRDTELVILRVAAVRGNDYELRHHRRLARRAGLTTAEVDLVCRPGPPGPWWPERQRTLLAAADTLLRERDLGDGQWCALRAELSEVDTLEFCALVAHYDALATVLTTLRVEPDRPRRARRLAGR